MMRQYELVERVQKYKPDCNEALLNKAYVYAMQKHGMQKRASGDPYMSHPLEVAAILTDMHLDESTIAVALLHDTIEDTSATRDEIDRMFGEDIGRLVEGLTKIKKLDLVTKKAKQAENLRKLLLAISDDVRVLLVKLADRLHNMRTLEHMSAEKRARISEETMDIYAPLAGRMGMQDMREELEALSFRNLNPDAHDTIVGRLHELSERNEGLIRKIEDELIELLRSSGVDNAEVRGRQKKPYSIFKKMQSKSLSFEQLSDVYGFRLIVDDVRAVYRSLGIVHTRWRVVPGRFKDYISTPKQNDYQSVHTTIVGPSRQRIELQIRTRRMHDIAEFGIAAHSLYKDTVEGEDRRQSNAYAWLRHTIESLAEGDNPEEFLEHTKLELFQDQVFCFSPKGKLIALPKGATPIDFAYAVHTNIGDTCVGAKINGRIMPLVTRLNNGDEVEIIRSGVQVPPIAWEQIVVTGKARAAIRRATRMAIRKQYSGLGNRILDRTFERAGKIFSRDAMKPALHRLGFKEVEDAIASVGRGELSSLDVLRAVFPDYQDERVTVKQSSEEGWFNMRLAQGMIFKIPENSGRDSNRAGFGDEEHAGQPASPAPFRGLNRNVEVHFSPSGAVPGDRVVGIMGGDGSLIVYPIQSPSLQKFDDEPDRWIDIRWDLDEANKSRFMAKVMVNAINEPGTLATVARTIGAADVNIRTLTMVRVAADFTEMQIELEVWDLRQLSHLIAQIKDLECIATVTRIFD